jgi:capsid protein
MDGTLKLPRTMTVDDVAYEWASVGMPWWKPTEEIQGDLAAIGAGLDTFQRVCRERGKGDWRDNVDAIAEALEYARSKNVPLSFLWPAAATPPADSSEDDTPPKQTPKPE